MRKIIYAINMSVDGCCDHTKVVADDELLEYHTRLVRDVDVLVFGRITYQLMVPYWPDIAKNPSGQTKADNDFAQAFDSVSKIVFSKSLARAEEEKTRIVRANLQDEMLKLKQQGGKDILVGGVSIPSQLMELGLIDEYRFVVQPMIAGEGRRLFGGVNLPERLQLRLVDSSILRSGGIALRYSKR
jgi:dihydrofolate reductase